MATPTTFTPKSVDPAQLGVALATLYTTPTNTNGAQLKSILLVNDSATSVEATIHLVPSGGAADDTNILCKDFSVPATGLPYEIISPNDHFLEPSSLIRGVAATANVVTYHISVVEFD